MYRYCVLLLLVLTAQVIAFAAESAEPEERGKLEFGVSATIKRNDYRWHAAAALDLKPNDMWGYGPKFILDNDESSATSQLALNAFYKWDKNEDGDCRWCIRFGAGVGKNHDKTKPLASNTYSMAYNAGMTFNITSSLFIGIGYGYYPNSDGSVVTPEIGYNLPLSW